MNKIESRSEYESVLERIYALMDALPGTPESEELEALITLVEDYDDELCADYPALLAKDADLGLDKMIPVTEAMMSEALALVEGVSVDP